MRSRAADQAAPAIAPAHLRTTITPVPPEAMQAGGMDLSQQPGMAGEEAPITHVHHPRVDVHRASAARR